MAVEVLREGRQGGYQIHPSSPLLNRQQELLLPDRSTEVTQKITVPGTDILQCVPAVEVLRAGREGYPLGPIPAVAEIIGIVIVEHRMQHVDVNTTHPIDDAHQTVEADPGVVMDRNLEGLL